MSRRLSTRGRRISTRWVFVALSAATASTMAACTADHSRSVSSVSPETSTSAPVAAALGAGASTATIRVSDGTALSAYVVIPANKSGQKLPLLVMPASWGATAKEYGFAALELADQGYEVISYAQRGFGGSGGQADWAAQKTQSDVESVVDWALANTSVDANQIGMIGDSYGGGIALLGAEHDPRIKAVVAMSTWTDLAAGLTPNDTVDQTSLDMLINLSNSADSFDTELSTVEKSLKGGNGAPAVAMAANPVRSPITGIAALNRNQTAVMIANDAQDSIIPPNQLITFFDELTGPKRLRLDVGDHGAAEYTGFVSQTAASTGVWNDALNWLNHYVRGINNGTQNAAAVQLRDVTTKKWFDYPNWAATGRASTYELDASNPSGTLTTAPRSWTRQLTGGAVTVADSGPTEIESPFYLPASTSGLASISPTAGIVVTGSPLASSKLVSGTPAVHLTLSSTANRSTTFIYLYDVNPSGKATLMSFAPYTTSEQAAGSPTSVTVALRPIEWTVAAGDRLAVAIDTSDKRFLGSNPNGAKVTIASTTTSPATVTIPFAS